MTFKGDILVPWVYKSHALRETVSNSTATKASAATTMLSWRLFYQATVIRRSSTDERLMVSRSKQCRYQARLLWHWPGLKRESTTPAATSRHFNTEVVINAGAHQRIDIFISDSKQDITIYESHGIQMCCSLVYSGWGQYTTVIQAQVEHTYRRCYDYRRAS